MADYIPSAREVWPLRPTPHAQQSSNCLMFFPCPVPLYSQEGEVTLEKAMDAVEQHVWETVMWSVGVSETW